MFSDDRSSLVRKATDLLTSGQLDHCQALLGELVQRFPNDVETRYLQSVLCFNQGRIADAIAGMEVVVRAMPLSADYWNNLSGMLIEARLPSRAVEAAERSLQLDPTAGQPLYNLGTALRMTGNHARAAEVLAKAVRFAPKDFDAWNNLGLSQRALARIDDSITSFKKALEIRPDDVNATNHLALSHANRGEIDAAISLTQKAVLLSPNNPEILSNLGNLLKDIGRLAEAIEFYRKASDLGLAAAHSNLIYCMLYQEGLEQADHTTEARRYNQRFGLPVLKTVNRSPVRDPGKNPLRIRYVSPDFREHPAGRFLQMILAKHDRARFEIFCYSDVQAEDSLTSRTKSLGHIWRRTVGMSDQELADQVKADGIDILVDCAMHMAHNRLAVFARKPAAVQISWLAYAGTSGLDAIGFRITDRFIELSNPTTAGHKEVALQLPESWWCIDPDDGSFGNLSAEKTDTSFTFGCLNNFCKVSDEMLTCWASLLTRVPDASLLVLADDGAPQKRVHEHLTQQGVDAKRIQFARRSSRENYLRHFQSIDISLDTLPYNGHITTLDSLWMGVPVVSAIGRTMVGRAGLSILTTAGLSDWMSSDLSSYIELAANRAADRTSLRNLRQTLRTQLGKTPVTDAKSYTLAMESAYIKAWAHTD